jgi:hypothetical protein
MPLEDHDELSALEPLPEIPHHRLERLRGAVNLERYPYEYCPECGVDLAGIDPVAHALTHYPEYLELRFMSREALEREALLYRLAGRTPPQRF